MSSNKLKQSVNNAIGRILSDKSYIKLRYYLIFKKKVDLNHPVTFNEKIQWLKLNDRRDIYTQCADKYRVREYVASVIGDDYLIPLYGVWNSFDEIDFSCFPDEFVLKCNHDSASVYICNNKKDIDKKTLSKHFKYCMKQNHYWGGNEWAYKNINPLIICEKRIKSADGDLKDFKFFCFNGKVKCFKVDFDRFTRHVANYYDVNGNQLEFGEAVYLRDFERKFNIPPNLNQMIELAEKLAKGFPFVRVDFYDVDGTIYFGEMTFYPSCGFGRFVPEKWDEILGSWLDLGIEGDN